MARRRIGVFAGLCAALAIAATPGLADPLIPANGPYVSLEGGATLPTEINGSGLGGLSFTESPAAGFLAGAALGFRVAPWRFDMSVDLMQTAAGTAHFANDGGLGAASGTSSLSGKTVALTGTVQNIPVMFNAYYDIPTGMRLQPFIGVGLGFTAFSMDGIASSGARLINSGKRVFAYQPMIGVNLAVSDHVTLGLEYRYFASVDPGLIDAAGQRFLVNNASHNLLALLTYHFAAPLPPPTATPRPPAAAAAAPMPPPPAVLPAAAPMLPPPTPASTPAAAANASPHAFLVFFGFDSAELTPATERVLDRAIRIYRNNRGSTIVIRGFADAVGTQAFNLDLSKRRALAVYRYLASKGVTKSDMGVDWQGKKELLVATPKREQRNRRVEIEM